MFQRRMRLQIAALLVILFAPIPLASGTLANRSERSINARAASTPSLQPLLARHAALKQKLGQLAPLQHYIVVDTAHNRLYVKRGKETVLTALASPASRTTLPTPHPPPPPRPLAP